MTLNSDAIAAFIARAAGASDAAVTVVGKLSGGAIQDNWAVDVEIADGPMAGLHEAVLRSDG